MQTVRSPGTSEPTSLRDGVLRQEQAPGPGTARAPRVDLPRGPARAPEGLIHRDLKPSNILVTLHDGVPVPMVIDFGLALATAGFMSARREADRSQRIADFPQELLLSTDGSQVAGRDLDVEEIARTIIEAWVASLPDDLVAWPTSSLDLHGMVHTRRASAWCRQEYGLVKDLADRLPLTEAGRARARAIEYVLVPIAERVTAE